MEAEALHVFYMQDARISLKAPNPAIQDRGTYRITDEGQVCATTSHMHGGHEHCESWFESDKGYLVFDSFGTLTHVPKIRSGNPEALRQ
jgi:hypothetical protein